MTYSYTQISQYLTCPRRYRHRYLDGWKEKDTRAAMLFGRAFERALGALFRREDPGAVLFAEWSACQSQDLHYSNRDSWDRMLQQGIMLLTRFCQDDRVQIHQPQQKSADQVHSADRRQERLRRLYRCHRNTRRQALPARVEDQSPADTRKSLRDCCLSIRNWSATHGSPALRKWPKSFSSARAWSRFSTCAPPSREEQRQEFGRLVEGTIRRIESADFLPHSGIRFPQNPCSSCPYVGLCLGKQEMIDAAVVRRPGAESLDWLDELNY